MVKIRIIEIGRDKDRWITESSDHFIKLLKRYARLDILQIADIRSASSLSPAELKLRQADLIFEKLDKGLLVALSDQGQQYNSASFAKWLGKAQIRCGGVINFAIGGPFGLGDKILKQADDQLSLSPMTFSHQLVRPVLLEQLYRGFSILAGTSYHK